MQEIHCIVFGKVQGVFFRAYTKDIADTFDLVGYVKNKDNGTVEIVAQSYHEDRLKYFISKVQEGSPLSQVQQVEVKWHAPEKEYEYFVIA